MTIWFIFAYFYVALFKKKNNLSPAHCPVEDVMPFLSATGQVRSLRHGQTATSKKILNFKI